MLMGAKDFWGRDHLVEISTKGTKDTIPEVESILNSDPLALNRVCPMTGHTAISAACSIGYAAPEFIDFLLSRKPDCTIPDQHQRLPIHFAANSALLSALIQLNAQPDSPGLNALTDAGETVLHAACMHGTSKATLDGRKEVVRWLLTQNVDKTIKNKNGRTAAQEAIAQGMPELAEMIQPGISNDAGSVYKGPKPLCFWRRNPLIAFPHSVKEEYDATQKERIEKAVTDLLVHYGVNDQGPYGATALLNTIFVGKSTHLFRFLIDKGANIRLEMYGGRNIMHYAANCARPAFMDILSTMNGCPSVNSKTEDGVTPLHAVCMKGVATSDEDRIATGKWLIGHDADTNLVNNDGFTATMEARRQGLSRVADALEAYALEKAILTSAARFNPAQAMQRLSLATSSNDDSPADKKSETERKKPSVGRIFNV